MSVRTDASVGSGVFNPSPAGRSARMNAMRIPVHFDAVGKEADVGLPPRSHKFG